MCKLIRSCFPQTFTYSHHSSEALSGHEKSCRLSRQDVFVVGTMHADVLGACLKNKKRGLNLDTVVIVDEETS